MGFSQLLFFNRVSEVSLFHAFLYLVHSSLHLFILKDLQMSRSRERSLDPGAISVLHGILWGVDRLGAAHEPPDCWVWYFLSSSGIATSNKKLLGWRPLLLARSY